MAALLLRPPGARRDRPARDRAAVAPSGPTPRRTARRPRSTDAAAIVFVADCLPVLLAADGAVAALHCGWRPLAAGIVDEGVARAARGRRRRARSPPRSARAPAAAATRSARRSTRTSRPTTRAAATNLDIAAVARAAARGARHRGARRRASARSARRGRSSPTAATTASPAARRGSCAAPDHAASKPPGSRENLERVRDADRRRRPRPGEVDILAAVKYVPLEEIGVLREAGLDAAGREPRAGARGQGDAGTPSFRWHFIGQLQSRKVKQIVPHVELIHSVASESALRQLERHGDAGDRDPARGQRRGRGGQGGYRSRRAAALPRALAGAGRSG